MLIDPARVRKPKDKPRVEREMPYARDSLFAGRDQPTVAAWRAEGLRWSTDVAGMRACRAIEGVAPLSLFRAGEAQHLVGLPARPFELAAWSTPKVHDDCHVKVGATLYSVPWRLMGTTVDARATASTVAIYSRGELIKTHAVRAKGRQTDFADYPPDKVAFLQRTPAWCRTRALDIGPACAELIGELLAVNVLHHLRAAQGVIGLAERYEPGRVERACRAALDAGDGSYRTVKGILGAGLDNAHRGDEAAGVDTPAFLHGPDAIVGEAS